MAVNISRSENQSFANGATDGKYRKARPDTEVVDVGGNMSMERDRNSLNPFMNYGYLTSEAPDMAVPGR